MEITVRTQGALCIAQVDEPRIDAPAAVAFKEAMRSKTKGGPRQVVLDLTKVTFIDSSGLGAIVGAMKQLGPDRELLLAGLTPAVEKVFRLTRMDTVFRIFLTLEEALHAERA